LHNQTKNAFTAYESVFLLKLRENNEEKEKSNNSYGNYCGVVLYIILCSIISEAFVGLFQCLRYGLP